jgi:hypothetical protein
MKRFGAGFAAASLALVLLPKVAVAQCEGGSTVAGFYLRDGTYVPGRCAVTNPTTPGQLYPSGAQPFPSTNPALGGSYLPGQRQPAELIPVNSSDLGPAPSLVNITTSRPGTQLSGANLGPGSPTVPVQTVVSPSGTTSFGDLNSLPAQIPPSGAPALTGNRADPAGARFPGSVVAINPPATTISTVQGQAAVENSQLPGTTAIYGVSPASSAGLNVGVPQGLELSTTPARSGPVFISEELQRIIITYPGQ